MDTAYADRLTEVVATLEGPWLKNAMKALDLLLTETPGRVIGVETTAGEAPTYVVASGVTGQPPYRIQLPEGCSCQDAKRRGWHCKHVVAVELWLRATDKPGLSAEVVPSSPEDTEPADAFSAQTLDWDPIVQTLYAQAAKAYPGEQSTIAQACAWLGTTGHRIQNGTAEIVDAGGELRAVQQHCECPDTQTAPGSRCAHRWAYSLAKRLLALSPAPPLPSLRPLGDILADLSRPLPTGAIAEKPVGRGDKQRRAKFVPHYVVAACLDRVCPGWQTEITMVEHWGSEKTVLVRLKLGIPTSDYGMVWREDGSEADDWEESPDQYGNPFATAKASALRRAAKEFGLGRHLYDTTGHIAALASWGR